MSERIFIIGAGRFGTHLASRLSEFGCEVVIGDNNPKSVKNLAEDGYHAVELEADDQDALREAGVAEADIVVVSIGENMQASILSTLILRELGAKKIIARAVDVKHAQVLEKVGADLVVLPSRDMAYGLAERLRSEFLSERMPISGDYQLAQVRLGSALHGWTLAKARLPQQFNVTVVLVKRAPNQEREEHLEPSPDLVLFQNDLLMVVGRRNAINRFEKEMGAKAPFRR